MNCNKFESIASELACGHLMEAGLHVSAMAHAEECAGCAARLADERLLTRALRAAAVEESGAAHNRIKAALLTEFQQRASSATITPIKARRLSRWAIAAAAAILAMVAIPVVGWLIQKNSPVQATQITTAPSSSETGKTREGEPDAQTDSSKERDALNNPEISANKTSPLEAGKQRVANKAIAKASRKANKDEAATDFISLTYLNDQTAMGSGTVVRVEMARSTLLALGLPMSVDRAGERVKADVVVGDDGLARAIRIVY